MNTTSFLNALRSRAALGLVFRSGGRLIAPGYHLTEVKRVAYDTMDCGGVSHRWAETQFEIWVPPAGGRSDPEDMTAEKFLAIIDRVERALPLEGDSPARIHAAFDGQSAALHDVASVTVAEGRLWIELAADRTRCKAAERQVASSTGACCGSGRSEPTPAEARPGCGCEENPTAEARETAGCCA